MKHFLLISIMLFLSVVPAVAGKISVGGHVQVEISAVVIEMSDVTNGVVTGAQPVQVSREGDTTIWSF